MKPLESEFTKNGFKYRVIDRSSTRYLAEVWSIEYNRIVGYETGHIVQTKEGDAVMGGVQVHFDAKERIPSNEDFGKTPHEGFWTTKVYAEKDFRNGVEADNKKAPVAAEAEDEYEDEEL